MDRRREERKRETRESIEEGKEREKNGSWENRKGKEIWKQELISTTSSNCGIITLYGFSRIQNIHEM
jgi:hypothetical protein